MGRNDQPSRNETLDDIATWFAESSVRIGLAVLGFVLLLFALGQAVGIDLLGIVVDVLSRSTVQWLLVAVLAAFLIVIAIYGFSDESQ